MRPPRRAFLATAAAFGTAGLAGCGGRTGDHPDANGPGDEPSTVETDDSSNDVLDARLSARFEPGPPPIGVLCDAGDTIVPDGTDARYEWIFRAPDGGRATRHGERVAFGFDSPGDHEVTLTVAATDGRSSTDAATLPVEDRPDDARPTTGAFRPAFALLDRAILGHLESIDASACTLAVVVDDEIRFERGYGWLDADRSVPVPPDATFRVGSISKVLTAAAIESLIEDGRIAREDPVLDYVDHEPLGGDLADDRLEAVTIEQALTHQGGWSRFEATDYVFDEFGIAEALELDQPPDMDDAVRYILGQPLAYEPGTATVYSNEGYLLLGAAVEGAAGKSYQAVVDALVLADLDAVGEIEPSEDDPERRPDDEVWYDPRDRFGDTQYCPNALELDEDETVPCPDGGALYEHTLPTAGHRGTARGLARVASAIPYEIGPEDDPPGTADRDGTFHFGGVSGSFAMSAVHPSGISLGVVFNRRAEGEATVSARTFDALDELIHAGSI